MSGVSRATALDAEWDPAWGKPGEVFAALADGTSTPVLDEVQRLALRLVQEKHRRRAEVNVRLSNELGEARRAEVGAQRALAAEQTRRAHDVAELEAAHAARVAELEAAQRARLVELQAQVAALRRMPEGDTRCGKVPVRSEREGLRFIALVCAESGESVDEYKVYPCPTCPPLGRHTSLPPFHIAHRLSRAERGAA